MLILCYLIVAASFFVHVDPDASKYLGIVLLDADSKLKKKTDGSMEMQELKHLDKKKLVRLLLFFLIIKDHKCGS
jgi:hypothetical protein